MADRDQHLRLLVGDLVLTIADKQAQIDLLTAALTNDVLRKDLVATMTPRQTAAEPTKES